ncbi:hypothetical protein P691DRAFT_807383 [Macrolepiota fuliginosa MF-IS2]|uniref:Uncharacterized protein n=1 Tax=Macrolepiota fuliginosa MF-IS2 TaxID=1400762 RepID=A0A9P6BYM2_9AGAR|nr:hypothetical protein P691DRAFT_807383 [Macrolepiota fuliginosa MF-IS2]
MAYKSVGISHCVPSFHLRFHRTRCDNIQYTVVDCPSYIYAHFLTLKPTFTGDLITQQTLPHTLSSPIHSDSPFSPRSSQLLPLFYIPVHHSL